MSTSNSSPWYWDLYASSPAVGTGPSLSQSGVSPRSRCQRAAWKSSSADGSMPVTESRGAFDGDDRAPDLRQKVRRRVRDGGAVQAGGSLSTKSATSRPRSAMPRRLRSHASSRRRTAAPRTCARTLRGSARVGGAPLHPPEAAGGAALKRLLRHRAAGENLDVQRALLQRRLARWHAFRKVRSALLASAERSYTYSRENCATSLRPSEQLGVGTTPRAV